MHVYCYPGKPVQTPFFCMPTVDWDPFNGCFALFSCLIPSSGYEDVIIGAKRLRIKKQVSPLEYAGRFQMSCKSYCPDLCSFRRWTGSIIVHLVDI